MNFMFVFHIHEDESETNKFAKLILTEERLLDEFTECQPIQ